MAVRAVGGADDVLVAKRAADTDRDRLLADTHVQETGELARAEALLDFLLETPDQKHLREELDQSLARQARLRRDGVRTGRGACHQRSLGGSAIDASASPEGFGWLRRRSRSCRRRFRGDARCDSMAPASRASALCAMGSGLHFGVEAS